VEYGGNDGEEVEDAIERTRSFPFSRTLAFEGMASAFYRKVAEASRRASFIEDRLTKRKVRSESQRWKVASQKRKRIS